MKRQRQAILFAKRQQSLQRHMPWTGLALIASLMGCSIESEKSDVRSAAQAATQEVGDFTCGYEIETGTYSTWPGGYQAWVRVKNIQGDVGKAFSVFLDVGDTTITNLYQAEYQQVDGGYLVTEPSWLQWQQIPGGHDFQFGFIGSGSFEDVTPYVVDINGQSCDSEAPTISLTPSTQLVTQSSDLVLTADAADNVHVRSVVFAMDGAILGEDSDAPYEWTLALTEVENGRHTFTATASDPSGNQASDDTSVLVAIGNRFLGSAPSSQQDLDSMEEYFNQLTPENASKWGVVEAVQDEYDWSGLDVAYYFAQLHGMTFKLHPLIWGQQQPAWLDNLTPEEQLAEIEEWMGALADRYGNVPLVEVVNEPMHAVPSYAAALGGPGQTGWDWVVESFELARKYFPNSELILNDYQVLVLQNFSQDYLQIIDVLLDRGLIDGIGVQAHFLERAEIPVVASNLELLAATGLPIYITELDVDLSDDARHANVLRDLFTTFWENPSVVGATHWGHLQGDTWQPDAYLIRNDGSHRPGFDWLLCYYAGGTDCTVPTYVPPGWQGGQYGLTLEAEKYDEGQGVAVLGDIVGYTDPGDFIRYIGVEFQDTWDTFSVTYAKGNVDVGAVSIILDDLGNTPIVTVPLPPTAGWGTSDTVEVPWPPLATTHDVYVVFEDVYGVANLDSVRFGTPPPQAGVNLVDDPSLESGSVGNWHGWWDANATVSVTSSVAHSGNNSLALTGRTSASGFNARYLVANSSLSAETTYAVSVWAMHNNPSADDTLRLSGYVECEPDIGNNVTPWIENLTSVPANTWTQLSGTLTIPVGCVPKNVGFYVEGPSANVDIFLDDATFINPNIIDNPGFEDGTTAGWAGWWQGGTITPETTTVYAGSYSLKSSGRVAAGGYHPRYVIPLGQVVPGTTYAASIFAAHNGTTDQELRFTGLVECSDGTGQVFSSIQAVSGVLSGTWTQLSGSWTVNDCQPSAVSIYVEGPEAGVDIFLDSVFVGAP